MYVNVIIPCRFARDGSDRTKGRDIVVFLSNIFAKDEQELRLLLSRHPNWCHIPVLHVKQCLEYLLSKKFKQEDILKNIHLLLYPMWVPTILTLQGLYI